jgi:hypothetical protein
MDSNGVHRTGRATAIAIVELGALFFVFPNQDFD